MLEVEEQLLPRSCALAHAVGEADQLLLALRCGANNDQQALRIVFQPGLNMNAVDPEKDARLSSFNSAALRPAQVQVASAAPNWAGGVNVTAAERQASHPQRTAKTEPEGKPASAS